MPNGRAPLFELPLRGAGGEPISFERTLYSHGCARLAPNAIETAPLAYRRTFKFNGRAFDVRLSEERGRLVARATTHLRRRDSERVRAATVRMFRLDDDLSPFYAAIANDERLGWAVAGAGRMLASPTIFEDLVKTICTTNCAWSATVRMTQALVTLGDGAFPEPELLAKTADSWYRDVAKMGYRGPYLRTIARDVVAGRLDLDALLPSRGLGDDEVEKRLLALPGIGPYAAAHVMQLLGRHRRLVLDSWTRPTYLRLVRKKRAKDSSIRRAFARYGVYAGLAFWLLLTQDWVEEADSTPKALER